MTTTDPHAVDDADVLAGAMRRALALASAGRGSTGPNPCVGAVVLDAGGQLAGAARTEAHTATRAGRHAEIVALEEAEGRAAAGTILSTLEPCNATGRTGPCSAAVLAAGVNRCVYAVADPTSMAGGGAFLREHGVAVTSGLLREEAWEIHRPWLTAVARGLPYVTVKWAASLDGRAAAADGSSQWISGEEARADGHRLRGRVDAIVAGSGTVLADDPQLTVRGTAEPRSPLRVVLDARGRIPTAARAFDAAAPHYVHRDHDLKALCHRLFHSFGVRHLLVEGGPTVAGAFLAAGLVDEVVTYVAPALLGAGSGALVTDAFPTIADARRLHIRDVTRIGEDLRITAELPAAREV